MASPLRSLHSANYQFITFDGGNASLVVRRSGADHGANAGPLSSFSPFAIDP